jgi:superfamily II DNA or RNA helicase
MSKQSTSSSPESRISDAYGKDLFRKGKKLLKSGALLCCFKEHDTVLRAVFRDTKKNLKEVKTFISDTSKPLPKKSIDQYQMAALLHYTKYVSKIATSSQKDKPAAYQGLKMKSIEQITSGVTQKVDAHVTLKTTYSFPHVPSKWENFVLSVTLETKHKSYAGNVANIRQLHFDKKFVASIDLAQFSLQDQQIVRFLAVNAEPDGRHLALTAEQTAEFFHCLYGMDNFFLNGEKINIRKERVEPVLICNRKGNEYFLYSAISAEGTILPIRKGKVIAGKAGCWLGIGGEYWWIPAVVDINWLRNFLSSPEQKCDQRKVEELMQQHANSAIQVMQLNNCSFAPKLFRPKVIYSGTIDDGQELRLDLSFDYDGQLFEPDGMRLIRDEKRFWKRDEIREKNAIGELLAFGFERKSSTSSTFTLNDIEAIGIFFDQFVPTLATQSDVCYASEFAWLVNGGCGVEQLLFTCNTLKESNDYVDLKYQLYTGSGISVGWNDLLTAVTEERNYLISSKGKLARIAKELSAFVNSVKDMVKVIDVKKNILRISRVNMLFWVKAAEKISSAVPDEFKRLYDKTLVDEDDTATFDNTVLERGTAFTGELRSYQKQAVLWLLKMSKLNFNAILADEMGLGKTVQTLALLAANKAHNTVQLPSLVVCPTSLVENWEIEAGKFTPELKVAAIKGTKRKALWDECHQADIVIASYAVAKRDIKHFQAVNFNYLILDEAQHIKNPGTANAKTCKTILAENRLVLTGTPMENRSEDLWSVFDFLHPGMLGNYNSFKKRYGGNRIAETLQRELGTKISPFMLRRKKADVCTELPPKTEQLIYCEMDSKQQALYQSILETGQNTFKKLTKEGSKNIKFQMLAMLTRLRQACCHPTLLPDEFNATDSMPSTKMELFKELFYEAIDSNHKVLVFSQFTSMLKIMRSWLDDESVLYEYLDGATHNRMDHVNNFNDNSDIPVFLLSLKAGGTGLNLTSADTVFIYDPWWNPAVEDQAVDRTHRIGQENPVQTVKLIVKDSVEEKIQELKQRKMDMFKNLVDSSSASVNDLDIKDFEYLFDM